MIDTHKNVIRYMIQHELSNGNKYVNNPTSLQMVRISWIDEKITVESLVCLMSTLENCLISTY